MLAPLCITWQFIDILLTPFGMTVSEALHCQENKLCSKSAHVAWLAGR